jgi:hypothetical protein
MARNEAHLAFEMANIDWNANEALRLARLNGDRLTVLEARVAKRTPDTFTPDERQAYGRLLAQGLE